MTEISDIPEADRLDGAPHPRQTATLFGQETAEAGFLSAWTSGRAHHAWLITGPRGVGKATLAWRMARFILAQPTETEGGLFGDASAPSSLDIAPDHMVSRRVAALSHPGLALCRRAWDPKTERLKRDITIDDIRGLRGFFSMSATDNGRRVVIVDTADEMNVSAANAVLKILEEPPERAFLLLISHRPMRLLPTIRSRCRVLACAPLATDALAAAVDGAGFETGDISEALTTLSGGSAGEAIRLLTEDGVDLYAALLALFDHPTGLDRTGAAKLADTCAGRANEARYDLVLRLLAILLHRLARAGAGATPDNYVLPAEKALLTRLAPAPATGQQWAALAQSLEGRIQHGRAVNLDPSALILDMFFKIDHLAGLLKAA